MSEDLRPASKRRIPASMSQARVIARDGELARGALERAEHEIRKLKDLLAQYGTDGLLRDPVMGLQELHTTYTRGDAPEGWAVIERQIVFGEIQEKIKNHERAGTLPSGTWLAEDGNDLRSRLGQEGFEASTLLNIPKNDPRSLSIVNQVLYKALGKAIAKHFGELVAGMDTPTHVRDSRASLLKEGTRITNEYDQILLLPEVAQKNLVDRLRSTARASADELEILRRKLGDVTKFLAGYLQSQGVEFEEGISASGVLDLLQRHNVGAHEVAQDERLFSRLVKIDKLLPSKETFIALKSEWEHHEYFVKYRNDKGVLVVKQTHPLDFITDAALVAVQAQYDVATAFKGLAKREQKELLRLKPKFRGALETTFRPVIQKSKDLMELEKSITDEEGKIGKRYRVAMDGFCNTKYVDPKVKAAYGSVAGADKKRVLSHTLVSIIEDLKTLLYDEEEGIKAYEVWAEDEAIAISANFGVREDLITALEKKRRGEDQGYDLETIEYLETNIPQTEEVLGTERESFLEKYSKAKVPDLEAAITKLEKTSTDRQLDGLLLKAFQGKAYDIGEELELAKSLRIKSEGLQQQRTKLREKRKQFALEVQEQLTGQGINATTYGKIVKFMAKQRELINKVHGIYEEAKAKKNKLYAVLKPFGKGNVEEIHMAQLQVGQLEGALKELTSLYARREKMQEEYEDLANARLRGKKRSYKKASAEFAALGEGLDQVRELRREAEVYVKTLVVESPKITSLEGAVKYFKGKQKDMLLIKEDLHHASTGLANF